MGFSKSDILDPKKKKMEMREWDVKNYFVFYLF